MAKSHAKTTTNGTALERAKELAACYAMSLSLENVRCFGPKVILDLSDGKGNPAQWTIVLGENGTGKTTLLQAMVSLEMVAARKGNEELFGDSNRLRLFSYMFKNFNPSRLEPGRILDPLGFSRTGHDTVARCELKLTVQSTLSSAEREETSHTTGWEIDSKSAKSNLGLGSILAIFYGYGAGRRLGSVSLSADQRDDPVGTLFDEHATLRNAEEWLLRLDYSSSKPSDVRAEQKARLEQVKELLVSILPDVEDIQFTTPTGPNPTPRVEFKTFSGWVPLRRLGYGYQTLIAWVTDFASRMVERYPDSADPLKEPAIVVVDEIDLHLHPTWQRKLIGFLSERFPNTQFIATAHSPLVVQAAENANLAVVKRVGDHVEIINNPDEIRGWRVDQILTSDLFGLKSARPPEAEALFTRKQELLDKSKLTAEEKKELKDIQARIDKLPVGDTARSAKEMEAIRKALELLMEPVPK